jgi:hypothetical protein
MHHFTVDNLRARLRRAMGISGVEDKIVQELARRLLEAIYEPVFLDTSYGFRPGRSCHDALRQLNHEVMSEPVNDVDRIPRSFHAMPHVESSPCLRGRADHVCASERVRLQAGGPQVA